MIEEVKKILEDVWYSGKDDSQVFDFKECLVNEKWDEKIYQLFPPYQDAQWSDKEGQCFWCKKPTHWIDIDYEGYVCSQKCQNEIAQDVKSKSQLEPKPDEGGLLSKEEILEALNRTPFDCIRHISLAEGYYEELRGIAKAQWGLTISRFRQAVKDVREGKEVDLTEEEFEVFSTIENLGISRKE